MIQRLLLSEKGIQTSLPHSLMARLSAVLAQKMGLYYPAQRWTDLERALKLAAPALGAESAEACARQVISAPLTQSRVEILAHYLTVGETYFFREQESLSVLAGILPDLMTACAQAGKPLRIWSAGCCTGEEPYSVAMLIDRLQSASEEWNVTIQATDINPVFLEKAARGTYSEWSFRHTPAWVKERYFRQRRGGCFEISPHIRRKVTFSYLNLADDAYPSRIREAGLVDIILCRNVLMYFSPEGAARVLENFHRSLVDGGWLIVGSVETSGSLNTLFSPFRAPAFPGTALYRKEICPEAPQCQLDHDWPLVLPDQAAQNGPAPGSCTNDIDTQSPFMSQGEGSLAPPSCGNSSQSAENEDFDALFDAARSLASRGQLAEAGSWCEKAIAVSRLDPVPHYLLAIIRLESGQTQDAIQSLHRAIYLDPDFVLAHFMLGSVHLSCGRRQEANRHFDAALLLLASCSPDEPLPESDGLTAARLAQAIESARTGGQLA